MISVLFCARDSVYQRLGLDCWDVERDARNWSGGNPGIFHPPCRLFCALKHFSTAPESEKQLAYWSVEQVRKWGGVLEHPARSALWADMDLPLPGSLFEDRWGFTVEIDQFRFGHPSRKLTWLYICGTRIIPPAPAPAPGRYINVFAGGERYRQMRRDSRNSQALPHMPKSLRSATPINFVRWLVQLAEGCQSSVISVPE